jgi:hypothetical protein
MNKRAGLGDILLDNVIHLVLLALFLGGMFYFVFSYQNGAAIWEDYYAKEIVKVIDLSDSGDEIFMDVHKASEIAKGNKIASFSEIFSIDNVKDEVCVKLNRGGGTCYSYFNDVDVVRELKLSAVVNEDSEAVNLLYLKISEVEHE